MLLRSASVAGKRSYDEALVAALAAGGTVVSAAAHARISERTARRRLADPDFARKVDEARVALVRNAIGRLSAVGVLAVDKLHALLGARAETVQLGASRAILEHMFKACEVEILAREVADLKRLVAEVRHGSGGSEG
jgi:hypothetical protein